MVLVPFLDTERGQDDFNLAKAIFLRKKLINNQKA
jgi:hypothetical protein